jgi:hypothetical protein
VSLLEIARRRRANEHSCKSRRWKDGGHDWRSYARAHFYDERHQFIARMSDRIYCSGCREWLRIGGMMLMGRLVVAVSRILMMRHEASCDGIAAAHAAERAADLARHGSAENTERERERQEASGHLDLSISNQREKHTDFA